MPTRVRTMSTSPEMAMINHVGDIGTPCVIRRHSEGYPFRAQVFSEDIPQAKDVDSSRNHVMVPCFCRGYAIASMSGALPKVVFFLCFVVVFSLASIFYGRRK